MKYYIILTSGICEMGGAEMFTANKSKYLKSKKWEVRVFYYRRFGKIRIPELVEYYNNYIPELLYGFTYIKKKRRDEIIKQICCGIKQDDEVVIESHIINLAFWGEMIARKLNGKSIVNAMEEKIATLTSNEVSFLEFKMKRMEILNAVSEKSFHRYFNEHFKPSYTQYTHDYMRAYCSNVITDSNDSLDIPEEGQNIMSIGRLDKPYIIPMFKGILHFILQNKDKSYNLLVIGGSPDGKVESIIRAMFSGITNVTLYLYGYVFPVPINLVRKADVGIAMANSIFVTSDQGIPTIAIDINDLQPIGIFERTTNNRFRRDHEEIVPLSTWLDDVLNKEKFKKSMPKQLDVDAELNRVFGRQVDFLKLSPNDNNYYDVESVYPFYKYVLNQLKYYYHKLTIKK